MNVKAILMTLPGEYWNKDIVWQIRETESGEIKFMGTWGNALKLSEDILLAKVDEYSWWPCSFNKTCKQITYYKDSAE